MKAAGVIVEYNPFHNGHFHHLSETRKMTAADLIIAVMSGNFLQRGEPAIVSKWSRARMALKSGADIVIELPYAFATQHAEIFASGSVALLDSMKCSAFCFGSESGDIAAFEKTVEYLQKHDQHYNAFVQEFVKKGMSYPSALSKAFQSLDPDGSLVDLSLPNNILGYHYIQAMNKIGSGMKAYTLARKNANYHDEHFSDENIASATSIRKELKKKEGKVEAVHSFITEPTLDELKDYQNTYGILHDWELYWSLLKYKIISSSSEELARIYEMEEGIENRFKNAARSCSSFLEFMETVKTKRYTWTRLQRMALHVLTNTTKEEMNRHHAPEYIRLLGMTETGRQYLNHIKKDLSLPLISKLSSADRDLISLDVKAAEIFSLGAIEPGHQMKLLEQEFKQPPIYLKK
ncbi:nucleotidyltransferase [Rossellomorea vietnamensis]|uniref:tRNA(Met) cytidine acetate ligase n=1 Tax=Rossellomorea vietnamensis TaxID=218284 RepID=A0A5D4NQE2_9BACI|nr:nucleotidyltransferase [Rossellomorea vietnamensis]TYS15668.1 nucleotidyltransferase [Rossellomorea vietnamensis]